MINERYSIEAGDNCVIIYGQLTIEEAFDFLSFYEKKGFSKVTHGDQNSTLFLLKIDKEEKCSEEENDGECDDNCFWHSLYTSELEVSSRLRKQIKDLEALVRLFVNEKPIVSTAPIPGDKNV